MMPSSIVIGTQVWEIKLRKRKDIPDLSEGWYGYTQDKECSIVIDAEMPENLKRVTLFHELLHAVRFTFGGSFKPDKRTDFEDWEHYWIGLYEEPVVMMLRDNPDLVEYLTGE
jgi:hypothetical protein